MLPKCLCYVPQIPPMQSVNLEIILKISIEELLTDEGCLVLPKYKHDLDKIGFLNGEALQHLKTERQFCCYCFIYFIVFICVY